MIRGWLSRLISWLFRRPPRLVRVHMKGEEPSITGFLRGRYDGHYVLLVAKLHESIDSTIPLEGIIEIPVGNVLFMQALVAVDS